MLMFNLYATRLLKLSLERKPPAYIYKIAYFCNQLYTMYMILKQKIKNLWKMWIMGENYPNADHPNADFCKQLYTMYMILKQKIKSLWKM